MTFGPLVEVLDFRNHIGWDQYVIVCCLAQDNLLILASYFQRSS